jgi:type IV secretion system protein TrbF
MRLRRPTQPAVPRLPAVPTPWERGRAEYWNIFTNLAKSAHQWRVLAFFLLATNAVLLGAFLYRSSQSRIVPYVVQVDRLGRSEPVGRAEKGKDLDPRIFQVYLAGFIRAARTLYPEPAAQRALILDAYRLAAGSARDYLDRWFKSPDHDPRLLSQQGVTRTVESVDCLPFPGSPTTFKLRWVERTESRNGLPAARAAWEAFVTLGIKPSRSEDSGNPFGIYVLGLNWTLLSSVNVSQGEATP